MSESAPGSLLREVARLYTRAQRVVADCCRTTSTQCHLLTELGRSGPLPLSELGTRVSLEKSWVSRAVEAMAARGLVTKEPNPLDARSWLVTLTADGERTVQELNRTLDDHAESLLATLGPRERAAVETSLLTLLKALREDPAATCCLPPEPKEPTQDSKSCC
ncbi:MarR family winged helix-turn-helix transcriptional regulator [Roseateles asaccharophilus]|uniref:DNA-binding MarR family transcriptional regulator n=1 Tax=Roseateles asaccharophilus TaxID=582607 RepID=A0ABU2AFQ1_9BURK|nr:MarR family winged helix-turn-helix transcriptional regulator [Roseateles asaccharophilus]MDR7335810.1 DNA-binding MarR family transcriptional regulator [Roseateles asaccharophilus]